MKTGDQAILRLDGLAPATQKCMKFAYHMRGQIMGKLEVIVNDVVAFAKSGNQGSEWKTGSVAVPAGAKVSR